MVSNLPRRLRLAQLVCRWLPPLVSQRVRNVLYPESLARRDKREFRVFSQTGSIFVGTTADYHGYKFAVHGYCVWRNWAIALALCKQGDTIVEVGANIGTETVGFRDIVGEEGWVHAFEPVPSNVEMLHRLIQVNRWTNVTVYPIALGSKDGVVEFCLPQECWNSGIGHLRGPGEPSSAQGIRVEVATLDTLGPQLGNVRALFIDAEGAEMDILLGGKGLISSEHPCIVLEASPRLLARMGRSSAELRDLLEAWGYTLLAVSRFGLHDLAEADLERRIDWVCLPPHAVHLGKRADHLICLCGLTPCIPGLNPLARKKILSP